MNYNKIEDIMMDLQLMIPLKTIVVKIQADEREKTIDDVISVIVDEIERETGCKLCSDYEEKGKCTTCQINKMIARVIDRLKQLKEVE